MVATLAAAWGGRRKCGVSTQSGVVVVEVVVGGVGQVDLGKGGEHSGALTLPVPRELRPSTSPQHVLALRPQRVLVKSRDRL